MYRYAAVSGDDGYDDDVDDDYEYDDDNLTRCKQYGTLKNFDLGGISAQQSWCVRISYSNNERCSFKYYFW